MPGALWRCASERQALRRLRKSLVRAGRLAQDHGMKLGPLLEAALYASDLFAAEQFYHGVLGLEVVSSMEGRGITFRCGAMVLLVFDPARTRIPDAGVPTHGASGAGHIAFAIDETETGGLARAPAGTRSGDRIRSGVVRWIAVDLLSRPGREHGRTGAADPVECSTKELSAPAAANADAGETPALQRVTPNEPLIGGDCGACKMGDLLSRRRRHLRICLRRNGSPNDDALPAAAAAFVSPIPGRFHGCDQHDIDGSVIIVFLPDVCDPALWRDGEKIRMRNVQLLCARQYDVEGYKRNRVPKFLQLRRRHAK